MAISKEKKGSILENLNKIIKESLSVVLVNFRGLTVSDSKGIRRALMEKGIGFLVAKNTLTKKALSSSSATGQMPDFSGETALVFGKDILSPAQEIYNFQKKLNEKITIVGGIFDGKFMNKEEMTVVANIPGVKTLQAQFVNIINSPISGFVVALNAIANKKEN
jgi:large subunit ribosomal protein L10